MKKLTTDELDEMSRTVRQKADDLLSKGLDEVVFTCPQCSASIRVQLDYCCGVEAVCETPDCFYMHMNLGLKFDRDSEPIH